MNSRGQEPAYPCMQPDDNGLFEFVKQGMTIREKIAAQCLAGILASINKEELQYSIEDWIPKAAIIYTDKLLEELSKEKQP